MELTAQMVQQALLEPPAQLVLRDQRDQQGLMECRPSLEQKPLRQATRKT
jgi:hypothetical protein